LPAKTPRQSERGSILILSAFSMVILLGLTALAVDAAFFLDKRGSMSAAADAAAMAGAQELKRNASLTAAQLANFAKHEAAANGFVDGTNGVVVDAHNRPLTGPFANNPKYVEVIITQPLSTFFATILGSNSVSVRERAVAGPEDSSGCIYALNTGDAKYPIELEIGDGKNATVINVPKCSIVTNGNLTVNTGAAVTALNVAVTAASGSISGTVTPTPNYSVPASLDPLLGMNQASLFPVGACSWSGTRNLNGTVTAISGNADFLNGVPPGYAGKTGTDTTLVYTLNPGSVFCGNGGTEAITATLTNDPNFRVVFNPGVYTIVGGGINWKHDYVSGTGVTFYFTAGAGHAYKSCGQKVIDTDAPLTLNLTAPTSGTYEGLLFIQDRKQGTALGNPAIPCDANPIIANIVPADMTLDGVVYFPNHHIIYGATTTATGTYSILIGGTIEVAKKATFNSNFAGLATGSPIKKTGLGE